MNKSASGPLSVNGYKIRESLRRAIQRRQVTSGTFESTLYAFDGEDKPKPKQVAVAFQKADEEIAKLQELQQAYNQYVKIGGQGSGLKEMTLALAVKLVGGAGRMEKMWRDVAFEKRDGYGYDRHEKTRSKDEIYAKRQVSQEDAMKESEIAASYAGDLRAAIAKGNTTEMQISPDVEKELFGG